MPSHKMHELTKFDGPWPHSKNNIIQTQYRHTISEGGHSDLRLDHDIPLPPPKMHQMNKFDSPSPQCERNMNQTRKT